MKSSILKQLAFLLLIFFGALLSTFAAAILYQEFLDPAPSLPWQVDEAKVVDQAHAHLLKEARARVASSYASPARLSTKVSVIAGVGVATYVVVGSSNYEHSGEESGLVLMLKPESGEVVNLLRAQKGEQWFGIDFVPVSIAKHKNARLLGILYARTGSESDLPTWGLAVHDIETGERIAGGVDIPQAALVDPSSAPNLLAYPDADKDGLQDIVVWQSQWDGAGRVSVLSSRTGAVLVSGQFGSAGFTSGSALVLVEDLDGDQLPEFAVGNPSIEDDRAGIVQVLTSRDGSVLHQINGETGWHFFGTTLSNYLSEGRLLYVSNRRAGYAVGLPKGAMTGPDLLALHFQSGEVAREAIKLPPDLLAPGDSQVFRTGGYPIISQLTAQRSSDADLGFDLFWSNASAIRGARIFCWKTSAALNQWAYLDHPPVEDIVVKDCFMGSLFADALVSVEGTRLLICTSTGLNQGVSESPRIVAFDATTGKIVWKADWLTLLAEWLVESEG